MTFSYRLLTPDDYPGMVEIMRAQIPSPPTVEDLRREHSLMTTDDLDYRLGAFTAAGLLIGYNSVVRGRYTKPGHFNMNVRVDQAYWGQGLGTHLYRDAERFALEQGATQLNVAVREEHPGNRRFAEHHGFTAKFHMFESRLDLHQFDPTPYLPAVTKAEESGIHWGRLADYPQDDATYMRYWEWLWTLSRDIPGHEEEIKPSFADVKKWMFESPYWNPAGVILAIDGEDTWAAMAHIEEKPNGELYNGFTGVDRAYRGRGLALAVKLKAMEYASQSGRQYIRTNNHSQNERMLAVNQRMGYIPEPGYFQMEKVLSR